MPLTVVGTSLSSVPTASTNTYSDLPLPAGTQAGDLLLFGGLAQSSFVVTDSRLTRIAEVAKADGGNINPGGQGGIWVGEADSSGAAVAVSMSDSANTATLMTCGLVVLRTQILSTVVISTPPDPTLLPVVSAPASLLFVVSRYGTVPGAPVIPAGWSLVMQSAGSGQTHVKAMLRDVPSSEQSSLAFSGTYVPDASALAVFGLSNVLVAPPGRIFPRDDDLGVGGGRIFPASSSQQRSGRQFGYY